MDILALLERVSRHRLLERLIRGRLWIGLVAFALIGIVTLQLALLKLNGGIGRALAREGFLQRENAALSVANSELASADHVQAQARSLGMEFVSTGALRFLAASPGRDVPRAATILAAPLRAASEELAGASGARQEAEPGQASASAAQGAEPAASGGGGEEQAPTKPAPGSGETRTEEAPAQTPAASESAPAGGTQAGP
jgi:hypothetical protein